MKRAYIFGCSHAAGSEMFDNDIDQEYTHSYPALIARDLGYDVHNHAIPGGSNDAIFRILIDIHQAITDQDLIIFCWIGAGRVEIWNEQHQQWLQFSVGQPSFKVWQPHAVALQGQATGADIADHKGWQKYHRAWQQRWLAIEDRNEKAQEYRNLLAAHALALRCTPRVMNIRSFGAHEHPYRHLTDAFYWPIGYTEFWNWCHENKYPHTAWGHFGLAAHRAFADHVLRNIDCDIYRLQ